MPNDAFLQITNRHLPGKCRSAPGYAAEQTGAQAGSQPPSGHAVLSPLLAFMVWFGHAASSAASSERAPLPPPQSFPQHVGYRRQPGTASSSSPAFEGACGPLPPGLGQRASEGLHGVQFNSSFSDITQHCRPWLSIPCWPWELLWRLRAVPPLLCSREFALESWGFWDSSPLLHFPPRRLAGCL